MPETLTCFICGKEITVDEISGWEDSSNLWCEQCAMDAEHLDHGDTNTLPPWLNDPL